LPFIINNSPNLKKIKGQQTRGREKSTTYTIAAGGSKDVIVAHVHEVEPDGIDRVISHNILATGLVLPVSARYEQPFYRFTPQPLLRD
jgi:hypothetical protein